MIVQSNPALPPSCRRSRRRHPSSEDPHRQALRHAGAELGGPGGKPIPVIDGGSASYTGGPERRYRYNLFEVEGGRITWITRAHDEPSDTFREVRREQLA